MRSQLAPHSCVALLYFVLGVLLTISCCYIRIIGEIDSNECSTIKDPNKKCDNQWIAM